MVDKYGNELNVGDMVAYVSDTTISAKINIGIVERIYKDRYGTEQCTIDGHIHIFSFRVVKLDYIRQYFLTLNKERREQK